MDEEVRRIIKNNSKGRIITSGNVVFDVHPTAEIELNADLSLGHNLRKGSNAETYLKMHTNSRLTINGNFKAFYNSSIEIFTGGELILANAYINSDCVIACANHLSIGDDTAIARGVFIYDSDHHKILGKNDEQTNKSAPVVIKNMFGSV